MNIISYRGPGMAGGVSAALARAWDADLNASSRWWFLQDNQLMRASDTTGDARFLAEIPQEIIKGHYKYCNDFLWPVMHDLGQYATYRPEDRLVYNTFNETLGFCVIRSTNRNHAQTYFVQDYQLALLPQFLKENARVRSLAFWHIPWPKYVAPEHVDAIKEVVVGLLHTEALGFHTEEYAENFLNFVHEHIDAYVVDFQSKSIVLGQRFGRLKRVVGGRTVIPGREAGASPTRVLVAPLGIDYANWERLAAQQENTVLHPTLMRLPFILSVDRADYTKGVTNRIQAIECFFEKYPEWRERIVFAQICGKTRTGLDAFDNYWQDCSALSNRLKEKFATPYWQPLVWIETSFAHEQLALLYKSAEAMMVNPVRDGLNLTAKEYVACQGRKAGVLALSRGAGAWHELGSHSLELNPEECKQMADTIHRGLTMDGSEKAWRMAVLKDNVRKNTLGSWWKIFAAHAEETLPADLSRLKESS